MASSLLQKQLCAMCENKLTLKENKLSTMAFLYEKADAVSNINIENESNVSTTYETDPFSSLIKTKIGKVINTNIIFYSTLSQSPDLSEIIINSLKDNTSINNTQNTFIIPQ